MKKTNLIFGLLLMSILLIFSELLAQGYVCIDPGHGGTDPGALGKVYGVKEKDANLTVALALRDKIILSQSLYRVFMIRTTDETIYNNVRAEMAKDAGAAYFISVHHNSSNDTSVNGTEAYYCNAEYTDSGEWRGIPIMYGARDSTFAKKVRLTLRDSLQHTYRCSPQILCSGSGPCCMSCYTVLKNTTMPSVLSEASFILSLG